MVLPWLIFPGCKNLPIRCPTPWGFEWFPPNMMREAHDVAARHNDVATTSLLVVFIDETEKRTWFLFEATRSTNLPTG